MFLARTNIDLRACTFVREAGSLPNPDRDSFGQFEALAPGAHLVTTQPTFCRTAGGTLRSLCPSTGRRERNGRRPNKRRISDPSAIADRQRRDRDGHYFAWPAPGCVAFRLCCPAPR